MIAFATEVKSNAVVSVGKKSQEFSTTIGSSVAIGLGQYLKTLGLDGAPVLRAAGLKCDILNDRYSRIPIQQLETAFEISALQANDPLLGLHFGDWYRPPILYAFLYAIDCAPNLRMALISVQDHRNLVADMPTQLSDQGAFTQFSWIIELPSASSRHVIDFMTMRTLNHIQKATGPEWKPLRVNLAHEKPENIFDYHRLLGSNIHFDQPASSFWIDSAAMAKPMPGADPDIYHMAKHSFCNPFPYKQDDTNPIDRLRRFISKQLDKNGVTLAAASKYMRMDQQQLRRLLKKHDTCFRTVLDETRKAHAAHYLCETKTCFSEIAFLLGFSDQSAFTRAVRRWYGMPPKSMRRRKVG